MIRRPPRSTRTATLFPYTRLFRSSRITTYTDGGGSASILLCRSVPPFAHLYPFRPARPAIHHNSRHVVFARRRQDHICYLPRPIRSAGWGKGHRSEEHTSELQSLMRISYAVFCLKKKQNKNY